MTDNTQHRLEKAHFQRRRDRKHKYALRILGSMIGALLLVITLMRVPIAADQLELGWNIQSASAPMTLHDLSENIEPISEREVGGSLQTISGAGEAEEVSDVAPPSLDNMLTATSPEHGDSGDGTTTEGEEHDGPIEMNKLQLNMEPDDRLPRLRGGMGRLYLNINYPEAARQAGIQGLMIMQFVVEADGTPTNIEVKQPLHPLTDSSAVRALRRVKFVPGRMRGENIAVRMNLPVRFSLINADGSQYGGESEERLEEEALSHYPSPNQ